MSEEVLSSESQGNVKSASLKNPKFFSSCWQHTKYAII